MCYASVGLINFLQSKFVMLMKLGLYFSLIVVDSKNDDSETKIGSSNFALNVEYLQKNSRFEVILLSEKMANN